MRTAEERAADRVLRREDSAQSGRSSRTLSRTNSLVSECKDLCHEQLCTASTSSLPTTAHGAMRTSSSEHRFTTTLSTDSGGQSPTMDPPYEHSASAPTSPANFGQTFSFPSHVNNLFRSILDYRLRKQHLAAQEAEYPAYGVIGPSKEKKNKRQNGDESMAYKAQLHHYQQTKQKIISGEETGVTGARQNESDESGDDADDGDYSVYECPGLAPTGDIEVQNPMFDSNASAKNDTAADGD